MTRGKYDDNGLHRNIWVGFELFCALWRDVNEDTAFPGHPLAAFALSSVSLVYFPRGPRQARRCPARFRAHRRKNLRLLAFRSRGGIGAAALIFLLSACQTQVSQLPPGLQTPDRVPPSRTQAAQRPCCNCNADAADDWQCCMTSTGQWCCPITSDATVIAADKQTAIDLRHAFLEMLTATDLAR